MTQKSVLCLKPVWRAHSTCVSWSFSGQHFSISRGNQVSDLISFTKQCYITGLPAVFEPHGNNLVNFSCGVLEHGIIKLVSSVCDKNKRFLL